MYAKILETKMEYMIQEFISGREFTCGVYEKNEKTLALAVTEIILTKSKMFDFETKYTNGACNEITPADIDLNLEQKIKDLAVQIHKTIGCKDISRTDFIVTDHGKIYTLEINTMPGMTLNSFIPKQVASIDLSLVEFIDILINNNLK
jgi:D-alanine-D-alanine ligase